MADLIDERPYGDQSQRKVWLARYEDLPVPTDSNSTTSVTVTLAFDVQTNNLVCAFTDPKPIWVRRREPTWDVAAVQGWKFYPARYESMRSSMAEVLAVIGKYHVSPTRAPQVVLRPRFNKNELGVLVQHTPPTNVWIVEILGLRAMVNKKGILTTHIIGYQDGELKHLFGTFAP